MSKSVDPKLQVKLKKIHSELEELRKLRKSSISEAKRAVAKIADLFKKEEAIDQKFATAVKAAGAKKTIKTRG